MLDEASGLNKRLELRQRCERLGNDRTFAADLDRIVSVLEAANLLSKSEDDLGDKEELRQPYNASSFGRKMQVPLSSGMDVAMVQAMNDVCVAEAALVNLIHDTTAKQVLQKAKAPMNASRETSALTADDLMEMFRVAKDNINQKTENVFDAAGLVEHMDLARKSARWFPVWIQATFEDFASTCDRPNSLELAMLAKFFDLNLSEVYEWFRLKRIENKAQRDLLRKMEEQAGPTARMRRALQCLGILGVAQKKS